MMFQIMKFDTPNNGEDFMILESIKSAPAKVIHVFDLSNCDPNLTMDSSDFADKNEFRIGRSVETDMKIADISVSRVHSYIRFIKNQIIVDDNGSKFGTLIRYNKPRAILSILDPKGEEHKGLNSTIIQCGRTMFYLKLFDVKSELVPMENENQEKFNSINQNDINLSYTAWKGTTFWRKTMLFNKIQYIPREFVQQTHSEKVLHKTESEISYDLNSVSQFKLKKNNKVSIEEQIQGENPY